MTSDNSPKISIIVPVLNGEKTLKACLNSLLKQTYKNYEIIIVDNNSQDSTKNIVFQFINKQKNILYVFAGKKGRGAARNQGLQKASGEIIAMIDADCLAYPNWLKEIIQPIIVKKTKVVIGWQKDLTKNYWAKRRQEDDWNYLKNKVEGDFINHLDTKNFASETKLLKKLKFDDNLQAYEDFDLFIRLKKEGEKIFFLPQSIIGHYHDASFKELIKTQFERGKNLSIISKKYQHDSFFKKNLKNNESVNSIKLQNFLLFIPWAIWQIIKNPQKAPHKISADLAWKIGILKSLFFKK